MTLPWGRGCYWLYWKSASLRGDGSGWSQLKTVWLLKDSPFCGWSPTETLTELLIDGWLFYMWRTSLLFHKKLCYHSVVKVGCGGSETWDFSESRAMKGDALTDLWESTNHLLLVEWGWLVLEREPIQNELTIDVRGPSLPRHFGECERRQQMHVLKRFSVVSINISASNFQPILSMQEGDIRFI